METATAAATLARATRFLGAGLSADRHAPPRAIEGVTRAKVIGNSLRELDRFLSILIDAVAADAALTGIDLVALRRVRNTPNKLRDLRAALALPSPDHERLRAIGRGRDCLFHTSGKVRRADARDASRLTIGWADTRYAHGDALALSPAQLAGICRFYDRLAAELIAAAAARPVDDPPI